MTHPTTATAAETAPEASPEASPVTAAEPTLITLGSTRLYQGDARAALACLPDNSIDAICTDPPYGLSKEPDITEVLTHWLAGDDYTHTGKGFMGSTWDSFVPGPVIWREAFRVLKPGGYAAVFASSRTIDLTMIALRMAGFEVRDTLMWNFGSGFPKSMDLQKALTKAGDEANAEKFAGFGTALKPGHEPIALVRKPLVGTVAANVAAFGTGGINIDASRVRNTHTDPATASREGEQSSERRYTANGGTNFAATPGPRGGSPDGRFPANVLFTHSEACVEVGQVSVKAPVINRWNDGAKPFGGGAGGEFTSVQAGDADGNDALAVFDCAPDCPIGELDNQSGILTSGKPGTYKGTPNRSAAYGAESRKAGQAMTGFGDTGGASRFFPTFKYVKKASGKERPTVYVPARDCIDAGHCPDPHDPTTLWSDAASPIETTCPVCSTAWEPYQHSTVKPPAVMTWLNNLLTPPGGTVLDLFAGTGTTGEAAIDAGFECVLIERDPVHVAMIHKRLAAKAAARAAADAVDAAQPGLFD